MEYNLCLAEDEYITEKPMWIAELSNGLTVYHDDDRPGVTPESAWIRLGSYLREHNDVKITSLKIRFCSHIEELPQEGDGYYFSKGLVKGMGSEEAADEFFIMGVVQQDIAHCFWFKVPELIIARYVPKTLKECKEFQVILHQRA